MPHGPSYNIKSKEIQILVIMFPRILLNNITPLIVKDFRLIHEHNACLYSMCPLGRPFFREAENINE